VGLLEKLGVEWGIVADGQVHLPADGGHILVLYKVLWIIASPIALLGDYVLGQAVHLDGVVVVGLLGIVETIELLVDREVPVAVGTPGLDLQGREAEDRATARVQAVGFYIEDGEVSGYNLSLCPNKIYSNFWILFLKAKKQVSFVE
jgi:hypothetical protein